MLYAVVLIMIQLYTSCIVACVGVSDNEEIPSQRRKMMISRDKEFDLEDEVVLKELRERMTYSDQMFNASVYLPKALRIMQAFRQNTALFNENASISFANRRSFGDLDSDIKEARANIIKQMRLTKTLKRNPSMWNEHIDIQEEIQNLINKKNGLDTFNASTYSASGRLANFKSRRFVDDKRANFNPLDKISRRYGMKYPYRHPTVNEDTSETLNRTFVLMRQIIYRTMERLQAGRPLMLRYSNDPRMRLAYLLKRLDQWTTQMHVMYTEITLPRADKVQWDWNGYIKDAIYYAHYFRKYIDVIYGVELVLDIHNKVMESVEIKMTKDKKRKS